MPTARTSKRRLIAVIEDNAADVDLLRYALRGSGKDAEFRVLSDGEQAIRFLSEIESGEAACPTLFILDLNLPKRPGRDVLERIRQSPSCGDVPVIVLSSSSAERDRQEAARLGANRYITKPLDLDEYMTVGDQIASFINVE